MVKQFNINDSTNDATNPVNASGSSDSDNSTDKNLKDKLKLDKLKKAEKRKKLREQKILNDLKNNQNNASRVNPKAYKTLNLSTALVATKYYNRNLVSMPFRSIYDETVVLEYKVDPINSRLTLQANCWAKKIISQQELYLRSILNATSTSSWETLLMRCYIYSYYKAVLYALTDRRVANSRKYGFNLWSFHPISNIT